MVSVAGFVTVDQEVGTARVEVDVGAVMVEVLVVK